MIASGYQIIVKQKADQRHSLEGIWDDVFPPNAPKQQTISEISGQPFTGKSELLFQIMARTVLPESFGGKSSEVIFMDLNHKHEVSEVQKSLEDVMALCPFNSQRENSAVLSRCLKSIINMSCYSSEQFHLALDELEDLLWDHENISLLAIDGLDAFYWEDCYDHLQRMSTHYKKLTQRLKLICQEHNICCVYTLESNYLQTRSQGKVSVLNSVIDYKMKLTMKRDGSLFLNDKPFTLNNPELSKGK